MSPQRYLQGKSIQRVQSYRTTHRADKQIDGQWASKVVEASDDSDSRVDSNRIGTSFLTVREHGRTEEMQAGVPMAKIEGREGERIT